MKPSVVIWALAVFYGFWETAHFGWRVQPLTDAETVCDGIALILFALACATSAIEKR